MIDWFVWFMGLLQGIISGAVGGVILLWFILPRLGAKTAAQTLRAAKKDPEIAPIIAKAQEILNRLEPLAKQFKNIDLEKLQKDLQPLIDSLKKIDPEAVEDLLNSLRKWTNSITEKPKIPEPD